MHLSEEFCINKIIKRVHKIRHILNITDYENLSKFTVDIKIYIPKIIPLSPPSFIISSLTARHRQMHTPKSWIFIGIKIHRRHSYWLCLFFYFRKIKKKYVLNYDTTMPRSWLWNSHLFSVHMCAFIFALFVFFLSFILFLSLS